jgi:fused signal recognition particle receptor
MFGALKNKLKGWIKKVKPEEEREKTKTKKKEKKETKKEEKIIEEVKEKNLEEEVVPTKEEIIEEETKKEGLFSKFQKKLTEEKFEELFEELEMILLQNNVAYEAIQSIKKSLAEKLIGNNLKNVDLTKELSNTIEEILINPPNFLKEIKDSLEVKKPFVILFAGINGAGKTTTIAKVANLLIKNKLTVCLAAGDTFRAASIEQLQQHADKLKVPMIKKDYGVDPASVGFEAIAYAKKNKIDVVLIDTAGRMNTKDSLMKEIEKMARVNKPDMKIFLGESITGNDATEQAKAFNEATDLTGIILSKADVDEKGGTAISVSHITKKPILFLGTGQTYDDLEVFEKKKLIKNLFG